MADLVDDGRTGLLFEPGNGAQLAEQVKRMLADEPRRKTMCDAGRAEYESLYTGDANHTMLMNVYAKARQTFSGTQKHTPTIVATASET